MLSVWCVRDPIRQWLGKSCCGDVHRSAARRNFLLPQCPIHIMKISAVWCSIVGRVARVDQERFELMHLCVQRCVGWRAGEAEAVTSSWWPV